MDRERLISKFSGCLLGAMVGDVIGAPVEAESPGYIRKTFRDIDHLLERDRIEEPFGRHWTVGRYTDDTQMLLAVAEWLLQDDPADAKALLARMSSAFQVWRRYGASTAGILAAFRQHPDQWRSTAASAFPGGSYGNGSAIRAAPIGLFYHNDLHRLTAAAALSSGTTHTHPLAIQGAALQAAAVAVAVRTEGALDPGRMLALLGAVLQRVREDHGFSPEAFLRKLAAIEAGLAGSGPGPTVERLGTGVEAHESVPAALSAALMHPSSFEDAVGAAVFAGGDTDSIASMTGAIMGALLGEDAVPRRWLARIREDVYPPARVKDLALQLAVRSLREG